MLFGMASTLAVTAGAVANTFNASDTSPTISTAEDLVAFGAAVSGGNNFKGKTVTLAQDIDLAGIKWRPIGSQPASESASTHWKSKDYYFAGTFNGNGHAISNLTYGGEAWTSTDYYYGDPYDSTGIGLFGCLIYGATVQNFALIDATINAPYQSTGAVAGYIREEGVTVENIYVKASVTATGKNNVAGITGKLSKAQDGVATSAINIRGCVFEGAVSGSQCLAGIVGNADGMKVTVTNCLNLGSVSGSKFLAGIIGKQDNGGKATTIENCVNLNNFAAGDVVYEIVSSGKKENSASYPESTS